MSIESDNLFEVLSRVGNLVPWRNEVSLKQKSLALCALEI